ICVSAKLAGAHARHVRVVAAHDDVECALVMGHADHRALRRRRPCLGLPLAEVVDRVPWRPERFVQLAVEGDRGVDIDRPNGGALTRRATGKEPKGREGESETLECGQTAPFRSSPTSLAARIKTGSGIFLGTSRNAS